MKHRFTLSSSFDFFSSLSSGSKGIGGEGTGEGVDNDPENDVQEDNVDDDMERGLKEVLEDKSRFVALRVRLRGHGLAHAAAVSQPLGITREALRS